MPTNTRIIEEKTVDNQKCEEIKVLIDDIFRNRGLEIEIKSIEIKKEKIDDCPCNARVQMKYDAKLYDIPVPLAWSKNFELLAEEIARGIMLELNINFEL